MKKLLITLGLLLSTTAYGAIECRPSVQECLDFGKTLRDDQKSNTFCYAQPQTFCDSRTVQHEAKEKQKYELREGRQMPTDYQKASTTEPSLGSQAGTIKVLPVAAGFSILAGLILVIFIKYRN